MTRETLYRLIDSLPDQELQAAARYLQFLSLSPVLSEEEYSEAEMAAMLESWQQMQRGEVVALEDVIQSLDPDFSFDK